jgi:hypothetical protein
MRGDIRKAVNDTCEEYIYNDIRMIDPKLFLKNITSEVIRVIRQSKFDNIKLQLNLKVEFYKFKLGNEKIYNTAWFNSNRFIELSRIHINLNTIKGLYDNVIHRIEEFTNNSSGWILNKLLNFTIKIVEYKPLRGSSYIELPEKWRHPKHKLINFKTKITCALSGRLCATSAEMKKMVTE